MEQNRIEQNTTGRNIEDKEEKTVLSKSGRMHQEQPPIGPISHRPTVIASRSILLFSSSFPPLFLALLGSGTQY
eukprot:1156081-Pelagomonas_calceolata.AAC.6